MLNNLKIKNLLIVLSSPSGAGKTSLASKIIQTDPKVMFSVSATTRFARKGEIEGREYFFKSPAQFKKMILAGEFLEYAEVFSNFYGTPMSEVENAEKLGKDLIFDVDWQGGTQIRNSSLSDSVVSIFILPPSIKELENRLKIRAQDSDETVRSRMKEARSEISHWGEYDYVLVNDDLKEVTLSIQTILKSERLRRERQISLASIVGSLNSEFEEKKL